MKKKFHKSCLKGHGTKRYEGSTTDQALRNLFVVQNEFFKSLKDLKKALKK